MVFEVVHFDTVEKTLTIKDYLLIYQYTEISYNKNRVMLRHHYINTETGLKEIKIEIYDKHNY
jgi:hypothetical protein